MLMGESHAGLFARRQLGNWIVFVREMAEHPEVFISATTRDLGSYRREIKDALLSLRIFPIEESTSTLTYGPLTEVLRTLIGRCDAVIHLAGFYYGAEPPAAGRGYAGLTLRSNTTLLG
jgi:Domain of unknown function (DUF4062)